MNRETQEVVRVVDDFLNEYDMWRKFKQYVEEQGYTMEELGFQDEEE